MTAKLNPHWPVLRHYDQDHLARIALPLGGIGTGTVSLGGRGNLRDWEVVNRPAKGFGPSNSFFALWAKPAGGQAVTRCLEGILPPEAYEGSHGATAPNHGLPRFRRCSFAAAYPFGQVALGDPDVPLDVRLEAFNPLVPADPDASSLPVAVLRFVLHNKTARTVRAAVCGSLQNFVGTDGSGGEAKKNLNTIQSSRSPGLSGVLLATKGVDPADERWGSLALATTATAGVTCRTAWADLSWGDSLLDFWDDFSDDGKLGRRSLGGVQAPMASVAARTVVPARGTRTLTFFLAWHFPNRMTWSPVECSDDACGCDNPNRIGNHYATLYADAWDAADHAARAVPELEKQTLRFVRAFADADLPPAVKEAALFNLSTLRSQTCFRTEDGRLYGWEGCSDRAGCCQGSCTHVWNYEQATAFLFGSLARSMREVEFAAATHEDGGMNFRVALPLDRETRLSLAAADGQMGCLLKLYRDWQLSGDDGFLKSLWPYARRALEFCWIPGGWDADQDGVMEGCQHNTMDVEYYGPNPQMGIWYLGALRAAEEMARHLGHDFFARRCRDLFDRGSAWLDASLFNGDYYEHEIRPPKGDIAPGLRHASMGSQDLKEPVLQLGAGCLVDQLVGQFLAHVCGLGYLVRPAHVRKTLRSIKKHNFQKSLFGHFNHLRSFALNDESALLMATYPKGRRPKRPFPYFNEVMTGFEYTAAVGMLYEGQTNAGLECIQAIRDRYDGRRRNPFDEAECGHHYARAMASWGAVLALTGFHYSGVTGEMTFATTDKPVTWFWSTGNAWGTMTQRPTKRGATVKLTVLGGTLKLKTLTLTGLGSASPKTTTLRPGRTTRLAVTRDA
ncbi:MAG: hypothetical protein ISS72_01160 [Candidatus Brocadiae bacterium]|nr:hypothetical protein [Candidatus Brocadiia bacterium]